jgi:hypothetical protein
MKEQKNARIKNKRENFTRVFCVLSVNTAVCVISNS